ncbi:MAG TPA: glycosyltransferase [Ktedonobacteraceae bacterium]|nr:glycosyltransferase [Ktedonobacteraceae bacterium]
MEPLVTIAIPDLSGIIARNITLQAIARHTSEPYEIALLLEKSQSASVSPKQNHLVAHQIVLPAPLNTSAALNRLLATCITPYILLLESGAIVTSGWLSKLLAPLNDPTVGLSGPSTNSSWNEQKVLQGSEGTGWSVKQIDAYAASIAKSYSNQLRSLDTLHSLGDFCYLFKRSVAEQLGGFDEAYGAGPCWEIDFNTRASRAGFRAVWVADAYVHRSPPSSWKTNSIDHHFTASKQLYQDRFCGLRLRGEKNTYEMHCRGEECPHFAPIEMIQVRLQHGFVDRERQHVEASDVIQNQPSVSSLHEQSGTLPAAITSTQVSPQTRSTEMLPLVSCIMPTHNRRKFVQQALMYFERQDYPNKELIIVDDGDDQVADLVASKSYAHYIALPQKISIGAKRNLACQQAHGTIIAHWDDDDWYAPHRLSHQVAPLLSDQADIIGLETFCFFDIPRWQAWTCTPELHKRLFVGDVHGGTLVYRRSIWERLAKYPQVSLAEDAYFLRLACRQRARLLKLPHAQSFVYLRHEHNAWRFPLGTYLNPSGWQQVEPDSCIPQDDLPFYSELSTARSSPAGQTVESQGHTIHSTQINVALSSSARSWPLVSCIMPTYNRPEYIPHAIRYFQRQDYPHRELIILDDGTQAVEGLIPSDPCIRYIRLATRTVLGAKRNLGCRMAPGTVIVHWDDDDWMAPHRLSYQVEMLESQRADLCGASRQLYYDPAHDKAWLYEYPRGRYGVRQLPVGNTLCYYKAVWVSNPFPEIAVGEDTRFIWSCASKKLVLLPDHTFYVGLIHSRNTSRKVLAAPYWRPHAVEEVHNLLSSDLDSYLH